MNLRAVLTRTLVGLVAFGAPAGVAWAVTHDTDGATRPATAATPQPVPPMAPQLAETWVASDLPGGAGPDASTTSQAGPATIASTDRDADGSADALGAIPLFPLDGTVRTPPGVASLREIPSVPLIAEDTAVGATSTTEPTDPSIDPGSTADAAPDATLDSGPDLTDTALALRFVDPCADRPSVCADLSGRAAIGGTIRTVDDPAPPVEIRAISVSGATSDGCARGEVPDGRRAVQVDLNRPADLLLEWTRFGEPVGEPTSRPLTDADRESFAAHPGRGWSACIDAPFPTAADAASALLTAVATADDASTATRSQPVLDDDARRLLIAVVDDDEIVAMTPSIGEVTLAAIELRDTESEVGGCRRAAAQVLTDRPAPGVGTDARRGREVSAELASRVVPAEGRWVAARFDGLEEAQRYAVCLFSIGRARGDLDGRIEATDAVLVQPPDRERYRIRPLTLIGPGSIDGRWVRISLGSHCPFGWGVVARTRTSTEQQLDDSAWCEIGNLPAPETAVAEVAVDDLPTSEATVALPAHCVGPSTCDPIGAARLVRLDVAGPRYTRRLCGSGEGACDGGLRPRDEVIGTVILLIERVASPVGHEGWTIGGTRRFSAEIPEDYWSLIDYSATRLELGSGGVMTARVRTVVPTNVTVNVGHCGGSRIGSAESTTAATDHAFTFAEPLGPGGCATLAVTAVDPTGERVDLDGFEFSSVRRDPATAQVAVEMDVVSLPDGGFPIRAGFNVKVGAALYGPRQVWACIAGPGSVARVDGSFGRSQLIEQTRVAFRVDWLGGCPGAASRLPENRVIEADVDFDELQAGPVVVDHIQPDGLHLRFRITATDIRLPR